MMLQPFLKIFEQIFNAVVSVAAAAILVSQGPAWGRHGRYPRYLYRCTCKHDFPDYYIYVVSSTLMHRVHKDKLHQPESYKNIYKVLTLTMAPVVLSSVIYQVSGIIDSSLYSNILAKLGYDAELISSLYASTAASIMMLVNVPMAMATALGLAVVPGISSAC